MRISRQIAGILLQIKAIKLNTENPFTWASGIQSPIYCDNRLILSNVQARDTVVQAFTEKSHEFGAIDAVAGVATAGIPHGMLLAHALSLPFVYVRSKTKAHGRQNRIEGGLEAGRKVLVIEDLVSTGGSLCNAVEALREKNAEIAGTMSIFTYNFASAAIQFQNAHIPYNALTDFDVLVEQAIELDYLPASQMKTLLQWRDETDRQRLETS